MNFLSTYLRVEEEGNPSSSQETNRNDAALFREAMQGVRPLAETGKVTLASSRQQPIVQLDTPALLEVRDRLLDDYQQKVADGDEWSFIRPGLQRYTLRKLRRGYWPVQGELDLHGLNRDEAYRVLVAFLENVILQGYRCVRVIHGRGLSSKSRRPVLKILTGNWLMHHDDVLAFCQALPEHGGSGAVLVLLRNADKSP
ncbi:DNA-nicking endonuclease, Smr domain [Nitrosomonas eutropha]|uniref:DNA-nicking endonuclease, Smr domain n=1 Tax=Nitrosomonas eutropha TaxID=916 RepID=A0A1I7ICE2_9PROT|nr:Smr/MutS family protein [Nitrosomonas eutropha]SFU70480.1 DNA-nicking endonuclease, Smr domain [Nitrosomonas eutropha]